MSVALVPKCDGRAKWVVAPTEHTNHHATQAVRKGLGQAFERCDLGLQRRSQRHPHSLGEVVVEPRLLLLGGAL